MEGFAMFAFEEEYEDSVDCCWLWQLMVDKKIQGQVYGSPGPEEDHYLFSLKRSR